MFVQGSPEPIRLGLSAAVTCLTGQRRAGSSYTQSFTSVAAAVWTSSEQGTTTSKPKPPDLHSLRTGLRLYNEQL